MQSTIALGRRVGPELSECVAGGGGVSGLPLTPNRAQLAKSQPAGARS